MLLPGPEAQQLATYIGWLMHRNIGGILAGAPICAALIVYFDRLVLAVHGLWGSDLGGRCVLRY